MRSLSAPPALTQAQHPEPRRRARSKLAARFDAAQHAGTGYVLRVGRALALLSVSMLCTSCGPHMQDQQSIKPYEQSMPDMPSGAVPTAGRLATVTFQQSKLARNPLPSAPVNLGNGKIYYGYYCRMCHGANGDGNGPVGQGYVPKPTDLSSPSVIKMTDGQLYAAMLHGAGHDPVMNETVQPKHRWPLVMYVRTFGNGK